MSRNAACGRTSRDDRERRSGMVRLRFALLTSIVALAVAFAATPSPAQTGRTVRIGILTTAFSPWHSNTEGFRDGLRELGWVEGRNVTFETRAVMGDPTRLPQLADELVKQ